MQSAVDFPASPPVSAATPRRELITVAGDSVVVDHATGLMWDPTTQPRRSLADQMAAASAHCLAGFNDWRVPTRPELESLLDLTRFNPAIDVELFPDTDSNYWYWSASPLASDSRVFAWVVFFDDGDVGDRHQGLKAFVRLVRSLRASQ